ncbi:unnamed protein product [Enterobius vermicularis]|uniref:Vacuolar protein sorting-associated protein 54 n=1 Tax=Enterobius vermicularis TaxID=51028 RepID=A0A158Q9K7_ENTVE|nr:unnamed protein product [Enterobius vermicularis]
MKDEEQTKKFEVNVNNDKLEALIDSAKNVILPTWLFRIFWSRLVNFSLRIGAYPFLACIIQMCLCALLQELMYAAPSSSGTESSEGLPNHSKEVDYPRPCDICCPTVVISDRFEFSRHLRNVHSVKEGGSYICRYGPNGICQTLPLEGVSDHDYEAHLRKYHVNAGFKECCWSCFMQFTRSIFSFTQNLASVLSDPSRSRSERLAFFTRHWGESFIPKTRVSSSPSLPNITVDHFKNYLATTAKVRNMYLFFHASRIASKQLYFVVEKHRSYLKARRALLRTLARHDENKRIDADDIPKILLDVHFSLADSETFEAIFLEPNLEQPDRLLVEGITSGSVPRCDSAASLTPSLSEDARISAVFVILLRVILKQEPFEAGNGRYFRRYASLQNTLEYFHDLVDSRLNNQLAAKSSAFWKTVISYSNLYGELADARRKVARVRGSLKSVDEKVYKHMTRIMELSCAREQRKRLLQKLQDIACLRDAQPTVQMLLNQNDYPKALECIETAQDVLCHDLRGVACFRHLSTQLQELYKVIGRMLQEEFIALIQKEFGRSCENENDVFYQEAQLNPVILGLLRVQEYKFVHVLQHEIVEAVKNTMRQVMKTVYFFSYFNREIEIITVKSHVVKNLAADQITEYDPSIGNLSSQMRRLDFTQWSAALKHVLSILFYTCRKVQSIQELIIENIDQFIHLYNGDQTASHQSERYSSGGVSQLSTGVSNVEGPNSETVALQDEDDDFIGDDFSGDLPETSKRLPAVPVSCTPDSSSESRLGHSCSTTSFASCAQEQLLMDKKVGELTLTSECSRVSTAPTPAAVLSMPCRNLFQVRQAITLLLEHAIYACQERSCRLLVARSKDGFLERLPVNEFHSVVQLTEAFVRDCRQLAGQPEQYGSPLRICITQQCSAFIKRFHEDRKGKLGIILDSENWRSTQVPEHYQRLVNECCATGKLHDIPNTAENEFSLKTSLNVDGEDYVVVGAALFLLEMLAQYCDVVTVLPDYSSELLMYVVELLKNYNSRSCQLILGAGALQLIGLKSISVRHLAWRRFHLNFIALSSRCLQLILRFVPYVKSEFESHLNEEKQNLMRHIIKVTRDYKDHIQEITNKLISVIDHHVVTQLKMWDLKGPVPSLTFQQICKQLGRFYNGLSGIMPEYMIKELFQQVHENFKTNLKEQLDLMGVTPHDSLTYGLASQEYLYYIKSLQSMPCCADWKEETISESLFATT